MPADHFFAHTDGGNARRFAALHGSGIRYLHDERKWRTYADGYWGAASGGYVERAAKEVVSAMLREASITPDDSERKKLTAWAVKTDSRRGIDDMLKLSQSEIPIAASRESFDTNPNLLTGANKTLDLRTGLLRAHDPNDMITLRTQVAFDADATAPTWERFLDDVFAGDKELIAYFQRVFGYCLTGETSEQVFFNFHGDGANGKSTAVNVLKDLLGDHAMTSPFDSFVRSRGDKGPRNDLARLHRARVVVASESGDNRKLDAETVKGLTGGESIAARFLYGELFEFRPMFKLLLVSNHLPRVDGDDEALWRRIRLIPFTQSFLGREDHELPNKLTRELPGILAWAVQGLLEWRANGLGTATAVERATRDYRDEEDGVGSFVAECLSPDAEARIPTADLYERYESYCAEAGERPITRRRFTSALGKRGYETTVTGGKRQIKGVRWS